MEVMQTGRKSWCYHFNTIWYNIVRHSYQVKFHGSIHTYKWLPWVKINWLYVHTLELFFFIFFSPKGGKGGLLWQLNVFSLCAFSYYFGRVSCKHRYFFAHIKYTTKRSRSWSISTRCDFPWCHWWLINAVLAFLSLTPP